MNLLLLSGESINNKIWIEEVEKAISGLFAKTKILYYDHWEKGKPGIDLDREFTKLLELVSSFDEYFLFAKSIGSVLSLRGIHEKALSPKKCIFVAPAFLVGERNVPNFDQWIKDFNIPSTVLCKTADPVAPAEKIRELLERYNVQNFEFVEIPGDNHKYEDLKQIKNLVEKSLDTSEL